MRCLRSLEKLTVKIFIILFFMSVSVVTGQVTETGINTDSLQQNAPENNENTDKDTAFVMTKSPLGSMLRSAILPGWGQIYTKNYWKAPVIWGFAGYYAYYWFRNQDKYNQYKQLYSNSLAEGFGIEDYRRRRDSYRGQRDLFAIYLGITYAINLLDAYVDAHLFDFSVEPDPQTGSALLNLRIGF